MCQRENGGVWAGQAGQRGAAEWDEVGSRPGLAYPLRRQSTQRPQTAGPAGPTHLPTPGSPWERSSETWASREAGSPSFRLCWNHVRTVRPNSAHVANNRAGAGTSAPGGKGWEAADCGGAGRRRREGRGRHVRGGAKAARGLEDPVYATQGQGKPEKKADFPKAVLPTLTKKHTKPGRLSLKEKKKSLL